MIIFKKKQGKIGEEEEKRGSFHPDYQKKNN